MGTITLHRTKVPIVGISSEAGQRGRQSNYIYGSAKAGFTAYLPGLRNRMFHEGAYVVSVQPGFVYTRMTENLYITSVADGQTRRCCDTVVYKAVLSKKT